MTLFHRHRELIIQINIFLFNYIPSKNICTMSRVRLIDLLFVATSSEQNGHV